MADQSSETSKSVLREPAMLPDAVLSAIRPALGVKSEELAEALFVPATFSTTVQAADVLFEFPECARTKTAG